MYGHGYFGAGYFGSGYFGPAGVDTEIEAVSFSVSGNTVTLPITIFVTVTINSILSDGTDVVSLAITGANTATPLMAYVGSGVYSGTYVPLNVGTDLVVATVNGDPPIGGSTTITVVALPVTPPPPPSPTVTARRQRFAGPASAVQIVNMALARIGVDQRINDFTENSAEARLAQTWYDQCRRYVLAEYAWGFAERRVALADSVIDPPGPWGYRYAVPTDLITARSIDSQTLCTGTDQRIAFQLIDKGDGSARELITDWPAAILIYTADITNVPQFSPKFVDALAYRLADEFAGPLTKSQAIRDTMARYYLLAINQAGASELNQQQRRAEPEASFIRGRE